MWRGRAVVVVWGSVGVVVYMGRNRSGADGGGGTGWRG